ncbi:MAG: hypothetical protein DHS20C17_32100 [Cyclobacteriaceae bacterium]|nr:MAG: hypothetical protein DHS20C17_32100 [Cyclobacteriaceae bacterium]
MILVSLCVSHAQGVIYSESFDNPDHALFRELNNSHSVSEIKAGKYHWKYQGEIPQIIASFCNRLDETKDFTVRLKVKSLRSGGEYGLAWGGNNNQNANYFLLSGRRFSICTVEKGKVQCEVNQKPGKIRIDFNELKIQKSNALVEYYINDNLVYSHPFTGMSGKAFGMALWKSGSIQAEGFTLSGHSLSIRLDEGLEYPSPPQHLGNGINTPHEEMTPVVTPNGKEIYFSRRFDPNNRGGVRDLQDVYHSKFINNQWSQAVNLGSPVNNEGPNAVFSVSPDGNTLLLMNTYAPDGRQKGMGLSISHRTASGWSLPEDVKMRHFYNKSFYNEYFLSNDGKVILLAVSRDDSYGSRDLYVSFAEGNGIWSEPMNLGEKINTAGTELSPFLAADGKTLYFSSNGHPGFGRNDIFVTRRLDESWKNWTEPSNLGEPINSPGTDAYYSVPAAGDFAFYVSNHDGLGKNDIFKVELPVPVKPDPVILVFGKVLNSKTNAPISTGITYHNFATDKEMGVANSNPDNGYYEIVLPVDKIYSFFAEKSGFYSVQDRLDLTDIKDYAELERDLYLTPIETGQTVKMHNVLFYQSKAQLIPTSYPELDKLARMMAENPTVRIELEGHTDNVGDRFKNQKLSEDRVASVKDYLVGKGVAEDRITGTGFGGTKPIADNSKELTRRLNRRVEFKILEY